MNAQDVLREALDQYVANQGEFVDRDVDVTGADREKLVLAEALLDDLNAAFLLGLSA